MKKDIDPRKLVKLLEDVGISARFIGEQLTMNQVEPYLKSQYNTLAKMFHPDKSYVQSEDQFKKAAESWDILKKVRPIEIYFTCYDLSKKKKTKLDTLVPVMPNSEITSDNNPILKKFFLGQYFRELQDNVGGAYFIISSPNKLYNNDFMLMPTNLVKNEWFKEKIEAYNSLIAQKKGKNLEERLVGLDHLKNRLNKRLDKIEEHAAWIKSLAGKIFENNGDISKFLEYVSKLRDKQLEGILNNGGEIAKRTEHIIVLEKRLDKVKSIKIPSHNRLIQTKKEDRMKDIRMQLTKNYNTLYGSMPEEEGLRLKDLKDMLDKLSTKQAAHITRPDQQMIRQFVATKIYTNDHEIAAYVPGTMFFNYKKFVSKNSRKYTLKDMVKMIDITSISDASLTAIKEYMQRDYIDAIIHNVTRRRLKTTHVIGRRDKLFDENKERLDNSTKKDIAKSIIQLDSDMNTKDLLDAYKKICTPVMNNYLGAMPLGETYVFNPVTILKIDKDLSISYANFNPLSDEPPSQHDFIKTNRRLVLFTYQDLLNYKKIASNVIAPSNQLISTNNYVSEHTITTERLMDLKIYNDIISKPYKSTYVISFESVEHKDVYRIEGKTASRLFRELTNPDTFPRTPLR